MSLFEKYPEKLLKFFKKFDKGAACKMNLEGYLRELNSGEKQFENLRELNCY